MAMVQVVAAGSSVSSASLAASRNGVAGSLGSASRGMVVRTGGWRGAAAAPVGGVRASSNDVSTKAVTGVVFEPFNEVHDQLVKVSTSPQLESLARQRFAASCEAAINDQINVEYNVSYVYHALYAYFDRDNVALPGFAEYFRDASEEERGHAEKLMKYQNQRGGRVKLQSIVMPVMEFDHPEKGDALYAMELALALEKLTNEKLLQLHQVAADANDPQMTDFIEGEFLTEQVEAIRKVSEYVAQLRRVGKGHGVYHFDLELQEAQELAAPAPASAVQLSSLQKRICAFDQMQTAIEADISQLEGNLASGSHSLSDNESLRLAAERKAIEMVKTLELKEEKVQHEAMIEEGKRDLHDCDTTRNHLRREKDAIASESADLAGLRLKQEELADKELTLQKLVADKKEAIKKALRRLPESKDLKRELENALKASKATAAEIGEKCAAAEKEVVKVDSRIQETSLNLSRYQRDRDCTSLHCNPTGTCGGVLSELWIMEDRRGQENFQLIVITHDERFAQMIGQRQHAERYYRISKDDHQHSIIESQDIFD